MDFHERRNNSIDKAELVFIKSVWGRIVKDVPLENFQGFAINPVTGCSGPGAGAQLWVIIWQLKAPRKRKQRAQIGERAVCGLEADWNSNKLAFKKGPELKGLFLLPGKRPKVLLY